MKRAAAVLSLLALALPFCPAHALDIRIDQVDKAQISGLTIVEGYLLLLPQRAAKVYWVPLKEVDVALQAPDQKTRVVAVRSSNLPGDPPSFRGGSGWEALVTVPTGKGQTLYIAHEDSGGKHSIYAAPLMADSDGVHIGSIQHSHTLPETAASNNAYESLLRMGDDSLIAVPEFSSSSAVRVLPTGPDMDIADHRYRVSDAASLGSRQRYLATSFCWSGEPDKCGVTDTGKSNPLLLCLQVECDSISIIAELALPLQVAGGEFNVEGIVRYREGILIANDNHPGGSKTRLRYLADDAIRKFLRECVGK